MMPEGRLALVVLVVQGLLLVAVSGLAARLWLGRRKVAEAGGPPAPPAEPLAGPTISLRPEARSWPSGPRWIDPRTAPALTPAEEPGPRAEARRPAVLITVPRLGPGGAEGGAWAALEERHGAIWAMGDIGKSAAEIAGETGRAVAEVELILALGRRARAARPGGPA